jgi:hypothetical protein
MDLIFSSWRFFRNCCRSEELDVMISTTVNIDLPYLSRFLHPCLCYPCGVRILWLIKLLCDVSWFRFLIHSFLTSGERHPTDRQNARSRFVCFLGRHALRCFLVASRSIWSICHNQSWLLGHKRRLQSATKIKGKGNGLSNKFQCFLYQFPLNLQNWTASLV